MIEAVAHCAAAGVAIQVLWVGDGPHRPALERLAEEAGVTSYFHFLGQLRAGDEVRQVLDQADLFVMPSRTEGLPRALIEAMARGLPCIGSDVGGIPELLPAEDLVPAGNAAALAEKIASVLADGERRARMSARNLQIARGYESSVLEKRRREFFNKIRDLTNRHYRDLQEL